MISNVVSFNEATRGHDRMALHGPRGGLTGYRCAAQGCNWHGSSKTAHREHLYTVWRRARDLPKLPADV